MKTIYYRATIKLIGTNKIITETFADLVVDDMTALRHCQFIMERFNNTLRKGESPREVVSVRNLPETPQMKHNWNKQSFDTDKSGTMFYRCSNCGITGKRYGAAAFVTPDRKSTVFCKPLWNESKPK